MTTGQSQYTSTFEKTNHISKQVLVTGEKRGKKDACQQTAMSDMVFASDRTRKGREI